MFERLNKQNEIASDKIREQWHAFMFEIKCFFAIKEHFKIFSCFLTTAMISNLWTQGWIAFKKVIVHSRHKLTQKREFQKEKCHINIGKDYYSKKSYKIIKVVNLCNLYARPSNSHGFQVTSTACLIGSIM